LSADIAKTQQEKIDKYTKLINEFKPQEVINQTEQSNAKGDVSTSEKTGNFPPMDWYVEKSNAEAVLGQNENAMKSLKEGLDKYKISTVAWHNLAKIYENAKDCKNAEDYYSKLIDEADMKQYYYDIAHCYLRSGENKSKVEINYKKYQTFKPGFSDSEYEDYIKQPK
jgi:tetratricopeptide (TPR) repeat protein